MTRTWEYHGVGRDPSQLRAVLKFRQEGDPGKRKREKRASPTTVKEGLVSSHRRRVKNVEVRVVLF